MASDGRVSVGDISIREDYKKLYRYSKNVCIGFSGTLSCCEVMIDSINKYRENNYSLEKVFSICRETSNMIVDLQIYNGLGKILLIVGGRSFETNSIRFLTFSTLNRETSEDLNPTCENTCYASASPSIGFSNGIFRKHLDTIRPHTNLNLREAINRTIYEASNISNEINTVIFYERIR